MNLTPTERKILDALADGQKHPKADLHACLHDELCGDNAVSVQLASIRKKLRPLGQDVLCERIANVVTYRHVRIVAKGSDE